MRIRSILIGTLLAVLCPLATLDVHAQDDTLYYKLLKRVEKEVITDEAELTVQRFAVGIYHDQEIETIKDGGGGGSADFNVAFEREEEEAADFELTHQYSELCGSDELKTQEFTCLQVQELLRQIIKRNAWIRRLGRNLQLIATGYETGIDGYPGRPINIISRFSSIGHLWRAGNDPFIHPLLEELTDARPYPEGTEGQIEEKANEIIALLEGLVRTWEKKKDDSEKVAAIWRYRHGVQYVIDEAGVDCADKPEYPADVHKAWLEERWCEIEEKLLEIRAIVQTDPNPEGNADHIIYPSVVRERENIFIWIRRDDVGLQWHVPLEPIQAVLYHKSYGDCLEGDTPKNCHTFYEEDFIARGGEYPKKVDGSESGDPPPPEGFDGAVVPEPDEGQGICSHPFSKRGYLCRRIESEACDVTEAQQKKLEAAGKGGIILTRCQPERFKGDVARKSSGPNICGIGGWRDDEHPSIPPDTPDEQDDMAPNACAACAVDVICKAGPCDPSRPEQASTATVRKRNVIEICMPGGITGTGMYYYLLAHEMTHAMQMCNESDLQALTRMDLIDGDPDPKACCASEREAYFVMCKLYAIDGILDKAGVTVDQCASALSNFSCEHLDPTPGDDDYICTNDGIDPELIAKAIHDTREGMAADLDVPKTCAEAMEHPRIKAMYNSIPLVCRPGCESKYRNTIGNNLCYAGQCIEEMHEWSKPVPGRMGLTTTDQGSPWDGRYEEEPRIGHIEAPPALTAPRFPLYRPRFLIQELDHALCQINGLPARTPPVLCAYEELKRQGLAPASYVQSVDDLILNPDQYEATGLGIMYASSGIGSMLTSDMLSQYLRNATRQYTDLLNMTYHVLDGVGKIGFPDLMCERRLQ